MAGVFLNKSSQRKLENQIAKHLHRKSSPLISPNAQKKAASRYSNATLGPCTSSMNLQDGGQRDSVRNFFESNKQTATSGIDEGTEASIASSGSIYEEGNNLEVSTHNDQEWDTLFNFQLDYRFRTKISVRKFLTLLGVVPTKSLEAFLWKPQKLKPSGKAGTCGFMFREKLTEFMKKELKNSTEFCTSESSKANLKSDSIATENLQCKMKKIGFSASSSHVPMQTSALTPPHNVRTDLEEHCAPQPTNHHNNLKRRRCLIEDSDTEIGTSSDSTNDRKKGPLKKAAVSDNGGGSKHDFNSNRSSSGFSNKIPANPNNIQQKESSNTSKESGIPPCPPPLQAGYSSSRMGASSKTQLPTPSLAEDQQVRTAGLDDQKESALTEAKNELVKSILKHLQVCAQNSKTSFDSVVDDCIKAAEQRSSLAVEPRTASETATRAGATKSAVTSSHTLESIPHNLQQYCTSREDILSSGKCVGNSNPTGKADSCEKNPQQTSWKCNDSKGRACTACGKRGHLFDDCWYVESNHVNVNWDRTKSFSASAAGKLYIASTIYTTLRMNVWVSPEDSIVHCRSRPASNTSSSAVSGFQSRPVSNVFDDRNFSNHHRSHYQDPFYRDADRDHRDRDRDGNRPCYDHSGPDSDRWRDRTLYRHFPCTACGKFNHSYERCFFLRCENLHPYINFDRSLDFRQSGVGMDYTRLTGYQSLLADDGFTCGVDQCGSEREQRRHGGQRSLEGKEATAAVNSAVFRGAGTGEPDFRLQ